MVGFVYNIGNVVVKQCIHNLGNRAVSGKVINVVFDVGIEVFQTSDQVVGVFPDLHEHDTRLIHGAFYQTVDGIKKKPGIRLFPHLRYPGVF